MLSKDRIYCVPETIEQTQITECETTRFHPSCYEAKPFIANCTAVDLFCGVGGLTYGLSKAGIKVSVGIDVDSSCQFAYEANNESRFIHKGVADISIEELAAFYPMGDIKILVGCAPCQDFSKYSRAKRAANSEQWTLLNEFGRLVQGVLPEVVSMENVPEIADHHIFHDFLELLTNLNYHVSFQKVNCPSYGVPQTRERFVLLASLFGDIPLIPELFAQKDFPTVNDVLFGMEPLAAGECSKKDPLHRSSKLSTTNMQRMRSSRPGGSWRDWPEALRCKCHQRDSGETYVSVYGRMEWEKPAPTLTTQYFGYGNGRFGHPEQDRAISLREGALLQSFPLDYRFIPEGSKPCISAIGRMVGNAVPPRLGVAVGESIKQHIESQRVLIP